MTTLFDIIKHSLLETENLSQVSSVVNLIVSDDSIFFIKRSDSMPTHKGDVAFIGGHIQKNESSLEASVREMEEETSLGSDDFEYLGNLGQWFHKLEVFAYRIKETEGSFLKRIVSNGEWEDAFFIHLKSLTKVSNWSKGSFSNESGDRSIFFCNLHYKKYVLWGMTAHIIYEILKIKKNNEIEEEE